MYIPYVTCTQLQIHQQRFMFPQDWASMWEKGLPPLCTTYSLTLCPDASTKVPFPNIKQLPGRKNFLYHFSLCTPLIIPMEEMKYTCQSRNPQLFYPCSSLRSFAPLSHLPPAHWREWGGAPDKLVGVHWNPVWSHSPLPGTVGWSPQGFIAVQSGSPKLLSLKQGSFIWCVSQSAPWVPGDLGPAHYTIIYIHKLPSGVCF